MREPPIQNPHDGFFKQTFGRVEFTRDFLTNFLPGDVAECLQLPSLEAISTFSNSSLETTASKSVSEENSLADASGYDLTQTSKQG